MNGSHSTFMLKSMIKNSHWNFAVLATFFALSANAASFSEKCPDLDACAKFVGQLLDQKYIYDAKAYKLNVAGTPNLEINKDNAELLFTKALDINGLARVPMNQPGTFQITSQRDARDLPLTFITASYDVEPKLPNTWDLVTLRYEAKNPEMVEELARDSRSFMPANSRIIPFPESGALMITDSAANLKKLYQIIHASDVKPSKEILQRWKEREQEHRERRAKAKKED